MLTHLEQQHQIVAPRLAGFKNLSRVSDDLKIEAKQIASDKITEFEEDTLAIANAKKAIEELMKRPGYPNFPPVEIPGNVLAEYLREQSEIAAVISYVKPQSEAVSGTADVKVRA